MLIYLLVPVGDLIVCDSIGHDQAMFIQKTSKDISHVKSSKEGGLVFCDCGVHYCAFCDYLALVARHN